MGEGKEINLEIHTSTTYPAFTIEQTNVEEEMNPHIDTAHADITVKEIVDLQKDVSSDMLKWKTSHTAQNKTESQTTIIKTIWQTRDSPKKTGRHTRKVN